MTLKNNTDPRCYNWLLWSVGASFLLIGGFTFINGGSLPLLTAIIMVWAIQALPGSILAALIIAGIASALKFQFNNAFLKAFSIVIILNTILSLYLASN